MSGLMRVCLVASAVLLGAIVYAGGGRDDRLVFVAWWATLALLVLWFVIYLEAQDSRRTLWLGPLAYLGAVGGCVAHAVLVGPPPFTELRAEGTQLVRELELHREREGEYPVALPKSWKTPVAEPFGGWDYERDFARFHLSVGDYARDGFTLYYDARGGWSRDT